MGKHVCASSFFSVWLLYLDYFSPLYMMLYQPLFYINVLLNLQLFFLSVERALATSIDCLSDLSVFFFHSIIFLLNMQPTWMICLFFYGYLHRSLRFIIISECHWYYSRVNTFSYFLSKWLIMMLDNINERKWYKPNKYCPLLTLISVNTNKKKIVAD